MEWITDPQMLIAFGTLLVMEIVLGIDNIIFIGILAGKLPPQQQNKARIVGLGLAMFIRIALLFAITWVMGLTRPLFEAMGQEISGRDMILIGGGLFLIAKATHEIHGKLEGEHGGKSRRMAASFAAVIAQILALDIVFSLDSVITAVGMVDEVGVMIAAVVVAIVFMMAFAGPVNRFVDRHPTVKMLALSFLLLIGVVLVAEGFGQHVSKGYIYFAMAFSVFVEMLNLWMRKKSEPVHLHEPYVAEGTPGTTT